jgi:2-iminobutanoate/2-iminopropanoate deaminase
MKKIISTPNAPKAIATYSQAVEANGFLFIAGQIPIVPATGKFVEGGIKEQTEQVLKNIGAILEAAGFGFKDVVKTTCLLTDMANYAAMNEVYGKVFNENAPARAAFAALGLPMGALVEIETIAAK